MKIEEAIEILERKTTIPGDGCTWEQIEEAIDAAVTALRSMSESGEYHFRDDTKLSLEQLKQMDGKPVWIEDTSCWGLVFIPKAGQFKNSPFVIFRKEGVQFEWHVTDSELTIYSYPPAHIDRRAWTAEWVPTTDDDGCVWLKCSACEYDLDSMEESNPFCPSCGRAMTEEAWAELERRLRMPEPPEEE